MSKRKSYNGQKFGRLTVIKDVEDVFTKGGFLKRRVLCKCDCGTEKEIRLCNLKAGTTQSCGCFSKEMARKTHSTHGMSYNSLYLVWRSIKDRCFNKKDKAYKNYGGRGISVCDDWMYDFMSFYNWCIDNGWKKGLTIDRINNDGSYEPDNCRFVTRRKNTLNQRLLKKTNSSGYRGVYLRKKSKKYCAQIGINGKVYYLGIYILKKDAVQARNDFIIKNNLQHEYKIQEYKGEQACTVY